MNATASASRLGRQMYELVRTLYPINRSITGPGVRETLRYLNAIIDVDVRAVPSGTRVHDWEVPPEWPIRDAYIKDSTGRRIVDFRASNLHVVSYSIPVWQTMSLEALRPHLHSLPERPDWIPYGTSYYKREWGFCLAHRTLEEMQDGLYEVRIDSSLEPGVLNYGEHLVRGGTTDEVLIFAHICHPSLCNDNLSGIAVACYLAKTLARRPRRYTYRFVFAPATIGSITWLAHNEATLPRIRNGLVLSVVGDPGHVVYKRSRGGSALIDRAAEHVLRTTTRKHEVLDFSPWGYDERQFCSPGINLPVGRFTRTPNGCYAEYHTSADDLNLVTPPSLVDSLHTIWRIIDVLERDATFVNLRPKGEPQLGRRGLYRTAGGYRHVTNAAMGTEPVGRRELPTGHCDQIWYAVRLHRGRSRRSDRRRTTRRRIVHRAHRFGDLPHQAHRFAALGAVARAAWDLKRTLQVDTLT